MTPIVVSTCRSCPFSQRDLHPWLCVEPSVDPRDIYVTTGPPPAWCPLRVADRIVTLRVS